MIRYFLKTQLATWRSSLSLYLLTLIGVSLGVASVLAIQIINRNAVSAFQGGFRAVTGETDLVVEGRWPSFSEQNFSKVMATEGVEEAWPIFRAQLQLEDSQGVLLEVMATDLTQPRMMAATSTDLDLTKILFSPGWSIVSRELARTMDWSRGETISALSGSRRLEFMVGEVVDFSERWPQASHQMIIMDIAQAQDLFEGQGEIHEISIIAAGTSSIAELAKRLSRRLDDSVQILTPEQERQRTTQLLSAFRLNLTALSLISLFVGAFLIYSSTQASLLRRRREFGLLRSLGATSGQVLRLILAEVALLAMIGLLMGIPLGYWAAKSNIATVNSTLTNIYLLEAIRSVELPAWLIALSAVIGIGSALAAASIPALDMSRKNTSALMAAFVLRERISHSARPLFIAALAVLGAASLFTWFMGLQWKPAGFFLGIAVLLALPLAAPLTVLKICSLIPIRSFGPSYSIRGLADRLQTTAFSVASLGIAIAMLIGITLMIGSFRETVRIWLETSVVADVYVTGKAWETTGSAASIEEDVIRRLEQIPSIRSLDRIRTFSYDWNNRRILLSGVEASSTRSKNRYPLLTGASGNAFEKMRSGEGVLVSEPLARKAGVSVGDTLRFDGPLQGISLPVVGITYDYTSDSGLITMSLDKMEEAFAGSVIHSLAIYLIEDAVASEAISTIRRELSDVPLNLTSSRELRTNAMRIFDQTFAVVRILQVMSLIIAAAAITLTLVILARERVSELALYRALGAQRFQIFKIYLGKGIAISVLSSVLGILGGAMLAAILIFVINRTYFGWTIRLYFPGRALLEELLVILIASVLASLYPAFRASKTPATELTRDDL